MRSLHCASRFLPLAALAFLACDKPAEPSERAGEPRQDRASLAAQAAGHEVRANAFLPIPLNDTANTSGIVAPYQLTQIGTAPLLMLRGTNTTNGQSLFQINGNGTGNAMFLDQDGTGTGMFISMQNTNSLASNISLSTSGRGNLITGSVGSQGFGLSLQASNSATGAMIFTNNFGNGLMAQMNANNPSSRGVLITTKGQRALELFNNSSTSATSAMLVRNGGTGFTAEFSKTGSGFVSEFRNTNSAGNGVRISTVAGTVGLQVVGGTKNAVVGTSTGARALHAEEATEVWFTDYGFGRLVRGRAVVSIDPTFRETVRLDQPYHVFLQPYGPADLYVVRRSTGTFEVRSHSGSEDIEFSYRIVGKRRGFEQHRLDRAPWADTDPNLR
jgi:hypothetical protein